MWPVFLARTTLKGISRRNPFCHLLRRRARGTDLLRRTLRNQPGTNPPPDLKQPVELFAPLGNVLLDVVTPASAATALYMINATARPFRPDLIPPLARPTSFNDDLSLGSFRPSKHVWSGEQRRGISMHVADAISIPDHVMKGLGLEFSWQRTSHCLVKSPMPCLSCSLPPYRSRWIFGRTN